MKKINGLSKFLAYLPGLLLVSLGLYLVIDRPQVRYITNKIHEEAQLRDENFNYKHWQDYYIYFRISLFEVTNPRAVAHGANPQLKEVGPFVYDIDEANDEINFTITKTYYFNQKESGNLTEDMQITVLNFAYMGTIQTILTSFPNFISKFGPFLHDMFPTAAGIFQKGTVREILFSGLPLDCVNVDKNLSMICNLLKGNPPPMLKKTDTPGILLYSIFYRMNGTEQGPFTVQRGVKNIYSLGNTTSFKNKRITKFWNTATCNAVRGTDSVTWSPLPDELPPIVYVYEPQLCRTLTAAFAKEEVYCTLKGYRYQMTMDNFNERTMECYCSTNPKKKMECLPPGLMDLNKCQEMPVIYSEPHFLHASSEILDYARGINSIPEKHHTFIVIEPLTGAPLSGSKKIQLNMKITNTPAVPLLANVTDGYFPILWAEETSTATMEQVRFVINAHRLLNVSACLGWPPLFIGVWLIIKTGLCYNQIHYQITQTRYPHAGAFQ